MVQIIRGGWAGFDPPKSLTADHSENHKHFHRCFMYIQMLYTVYICLHHFIWDMFTVNAGRYTISVAFGICKFTTFTRQHPAAIEHHYWADFMLPWALCLSPISMTLNGESHTHTKTHTLPTSLNTHGERWWTIHVWKSSDGRAAPRRIFRRGNVLCE